MKLLSKTTYISLCLLIACASQSIAQTKIILRNRNSKDVEIKWYSQKLFYEEGVNIYRKEQGQTTWEKLNSTVITSGELSEEEKEKNEDLEFWEDVVQQGDPNNLPALLYVQMLSKSFLEPDFASFLGVRYIDKTAVAGKVYQYQIKQLMKGRELVVATSDPFEVGAYVALPPPQNFEAVQKKDVIKLNWEMDESRFFAYHVYRASAIDKGWVKVNRDPVIIALEENEQGEEVYPDIKYRDDSLETDIAYRYYIQGVDYFGDTSLKSAPFILTFGDSIPPMPPVNLKIGEIEAKDLEVPLIWFNQYTDDMVAVQVYRGLHSEGPFEAVREKVFPKETEDYKDEVPQPGGYYYYVTAIDGSGNEAKSSLVYADIKDVIPPKQPQNLRIESDTGRLSLTWDANTEGDLKGYRILRTIKGADDGYVPINVELLKEAKYEDEMFKNAKNTFLYKVIAMDTSLNASIPSDFVGASMPDAIPPSKPLLKEVREKEGALVISWMPCADIDIEGYDLYRSVDDTNFFKKHNLNTLDANLFRYTDHRATYEHEYFYRLQAIDESGNVSPFSQIISGKRDAAKQKVEGAKNIQLKRLKGYKQTRITWNAPKVKAEVRGYIIMRKEEGDQFKPMTGMINDAYIFLDNVAKDKTYIYQIRTYFPTGQYVYSKEFVSEGKKSSKK